MKYSPKLKKVIGEIEKIIRDNDLAGYVCLVQPGHSEYIHVLDPSFSCAKINGDSVRINTKSLNISPQRKKEILKNTANMLVLMSTTVMQCGLHLGTISQFVDAQTGANHTDGEHTSQMEIDN